MSKHELPDPSDGENSTLLGRLKSLTNRRKRPDSPVKHQLKETGTDDYWKLIEGALSIAGFSFRGHTITSSTGGKKYVIQVADRSYPDNNLKSYQIEVQRESSTNFTCRPVYSVNEPLHLALSELCNRIRTARQGYTITMTNEPEYN